ncbi:MAG TPA: Na+-transporting NADH:ubiquinone oxidoreductase, subunit NqrB [Cyanobacteria bacterium UBA11149]|nr:Na+-transporting NADH:ubiquinone oxidoreductase, subunit NqrB [Cyanobacteria bacterium UBA11367]HBE56543.1 Na+-transporting NADH:ubiquinone oxidoreductase, subunit NqrB [Cyanobacteria bacterium UBA11366]HBK62363.1 Na+-transporting NADH:ubiquinone oxidoreductase, subunit NqrB [Cyanobacteria bacterium UBA11166]HBR75668.1 Na+-transporting NADH:ubiquinone oxidoreductase, subunit NqrB [Cyanobacteria bacterium UBA11159]HBS68598.1 Na+-transporting NADH:ubiquinone oxidoreductase, subunit NqrB [Cyano
MLRQDSRNYQILFLSLFLILGVSMRDWTIRPDLIIVAIATCLITQWIALSIWSNGQGSLLNLLTRGEDRYSDNLDKEEFRIPQASFHLFSVITRIFSTPIRLESLKSAVITALSLSLLLRVDNYTTMIIAGALAILSKFIFQVRGKHFFNPSNFGIVAAIILTNDAWVSPGQWGDEIWYALLFAGAGGLVLKKVGRWDTTVAFLGSYAFLEAVRNIWLGWTWDVFAHRMMSGSLLLFALFMITDPRSIPNARIGRLFWAGAIAILTFVLRNYFFLPTAVFFALFALSPLTIILDGIWSFPRFSWDKARQLKQLNV